MGKLALDLDKLSRDEQLDLLDELWARLSQAGHATPLTAEQDAELDRRIDAVGREGAVGVSPEQLIERIQKRSA
ncbi:MAG TPA: addiction module protein [Polyangia bacterium]|nr:addiction module protein [Polyangia bacterium]